MTLSLYRQVQRFQVCSHARLQLWVLSRLPADRRMFSQIINSMEKNNWYLGRRSTFVHVLGNEPSYLLCDREHLSMFCFVRAIFNKRKQIANCLPLLLAFLGKIGFLIVFNDIKISIHITRVHNASLEKTGQLWTLQRRCSSKKQEQVLWAYLV